MIYLPRSTGRGIEQVCVASGGSFLGVFIAFLCPLCVPASAAFLSSIGLTFLPQKTAIFPLVALFSAVTLGGLILGLRRHDDLTPLLFGALGIIAVPLGRYVIGSALLTYTGAFSLFAATLWNLLLQATTPHPHVRNEDVQHLLEHTAV